MATTTTDGVQALYRKAATIAMQYELSRRDGEEYMRRWDSSKYEESSEQRAAWAPIARRRYEIEQELRVVGAKLIAIEDEHFESEQKQIA